MDRYTKPDFKASSLIIVDAQNDFLDREPFSIIASAGVVSNIARLAGLFRGKEFPVIHVVRLYESGGGNADMCRKAKIEAGFNIATPGSEGSQIPDEILPEAGVKLDHDLLLSGGVQEIGPKEFIIYKPRWGAFYKTSLDNHLKKLRVNTLVFAGCNFPNCPRTSMYEASERDYRLALIEDSVSGLYERGEEEMAAIGVTVMNYDEIAEALSG